MQQTTENSLKSFSHLDVTHKLINSEECCRIGNGFVSDHIIKLEQWGQISALTEENRKKTLLAALPPRYEAIRTWGFTPKTPLWGQAVHTWVINNDTSY